MHFIKLVSDAGERIDQSKITELLLCRKTKYAAILIYF